MKKWMFFGLAALAAGVASADDLLDSVLDWDAPVMRPASGTPAPAAVPAVEVPAESRRPVQRPPAERPLARMPGMRPAPREEEEQEPVISEEPPESQLRQRLPGSDLWLRWASEEEDGDEESSGFDDGDTSAAGMERRQRVSLRGGGGASDALSVDGEWICPLGKSPFDFSLRGFYASKDYVIHRSYRDYDYTYSSRRGWRKRYYTKTVTTEEVIHYYGGDAVALWRPLRSEVFSPYAGVGARYERCETGVETYAEDDFSLAWRVGAALNLERFAPGVEFSGGKGGTQFTGSLGFRCTSHFALSAFGNWFETEDHDGKKHDGLTFGAGVTWLF